MAGRTSSGRQAVARRKTAAVLRRLEKHFGVPRQQAGDPTESIIRAILSQNTTDVNSARAYESLREKFPSWESLAAARESSIARAIALCGLANQKARAIRNLFRFLKEKWGVVTLDPIAALPDDQAIETLTQVSGVGVKTAAVTLLFSLQRDIFVVDTHVHRVCNRLGLVRTRQRNETFDEMRSLTPKGKAFSLHVNMIRLGREICRARTPRCGECPLEDLCERVGVGEK